MNARRGVAFGACLLALLTIGCGEADPVAERTSVDDCQGPDGLMLTPPRDPFVVYLCRDGEPLPDDLVVTLANDDYEETVSLEAVLAAGMWLYPCVIREDEPAGAGVPAGPWLVCSWGYQADGDTGTLDAAASGFAPVHAVLAPTRCGGSPPAQLFVLQPE